MLEKQAAIEASEKKIDVFPDAVSISSKIEKRRPRVKANQGIKKKRARAEKKIRRRSPSPEKSVVQQDSLFWENQVDNAHEQKIPININIGEDDNSNYDFSASEMKMLSSAKKALAVDAAVAQGKRINKSE